MKIFEETYAASTARGTIHPEYADRGPEIRRLLANERVVPEPSFVQFGIAAPRHIHDAVQSAVRRFAGPRWADDWRKPKLLFDFKDVGKHTGEQLVRNTLYPILSSPQMALSLPIDYADRSHPLRSVHETSTGDIDLPSMFGKAEFVRSESEPLVQLADVIAWVARRALNHPEDAAAQAAYRSLKRRQYATTNARFRFMSRRNLSVADLRRYRHLLGVS